jgi:hypothetical protein
MWYQSIVLPVREGRTNCCTRRFGSWHSLLRCLPRLLVQNVLVFWFTNSMVLVPNAAAGSDSQRRGAVARGTAAALDVRRILNMHSYAVQKSVCAIAIVLFASFTSGSAAACSCIMSKERSSEVREWIGAMLENRENVALLRAVSVEEAGEFHERAVLRIIKSWKGKPQGSLVHSDTKDIGGGMCDMSIEAGQEILVAFDAEPIVINGCPSDFELTNMEQKYLDRLAPRYRKQNRLAPTSAEATPTDGNDSK